MEEPQRSVSSPFRAGLVSITFRKLSPAEVIGLVVQAGLEVIEWGGDVHVPHGDVGCGREVGARTRDAGLAVSSYGSYYRAGESGGENPPFEAVLETALALQAPVIRIWAGRQGPEKADAEARARVVDDSRRVAELAQKEGVRVGVEYHAGTLTATDASAAQYLDEVAHPNLEPYWQPPNNCPMEQNRAGLEAIASRVSVVHVFHWVYNESGRNRCRLAEGAGVWAPYIQTLRAAPRERAALLEFVRGDTPKQFLEDAAVLRDWLA